MATCEKHAAEMKVWMFVLCLSNGLMQSVSITDAAPAQSSAPVTLAVDESTQLVVKKTNKPLAQSHNHTSAKGH